MLYLGIAFALPGAAAADLYRAVLEHDSNHFDGLYNLGVINGRRGRFAEAERNLHGAIRSRPDDANAHFALAMAYASLEKFPEADLEMKTVLRLDPAHEGAIELLSG